MRGLRAVAGLFTVAGLLALAVSGCGGEQDGYEPATRYPLRADPLVVRLPSSAPVGLPPPGRLDHSIRELPKAGGVLASSDELSADDQASIAGVVDELFGTPAAPVVPGYAGEYDLSPETLAAGSRVYQRLCANCHGLSGDGRGPVGPWSYPYPRDFRTGGFKVAVGDDRPSPEQLTRVLRQGVPGSAMPIFDMLPDADVTAVIGYVVHLSRRGHAEAAGLRAAADGDDPVSAVRQAAEADGQRWRRTPIAVEPVTVPNHGEPGYDSAVRRGRELFASAAAGCFSCHQDYGRTEGFRYDSWGTPVRVPDLTRGEFRWGRDDATLAARVRHGIPAAGMPASPHLTTEQVRDLVAFVRDLSAPARLPADVRSEVYPQAATR